MAPFCTLLLLDRGDIKVWLLQDIKKRPARVAIVAGDLKVVSEDLGLNRAVL